MKPSRRTALIAGAAAPLWSLRVPAQAAEFAYKYGHNNPVESPLHVRMTQMWNAVERETGGRLAVKVFPNSQLGGESDMLSQLRLGALEFFALSGTPLSTVVPATAIATLPFVFKSRDQAYGAVDGPLGAYVRSEIEAKGIVVFEKAWELGFYQTTNSLRPIRTVDDFAGLRLRAASGKMAVDTLRSLGASPTAFDIKEAYMAMKTRLVDGQINPYVLIEVNKYYEVQRYLTDINLSWSNYWVMASRGPWNALPPDVQAVVTRNMAKYALVQRRDMQLLSDVSADKLTRQGLLKNVADPTTFRSKLTESGFFARWKAEFGAQAWTLLEAARGEKLT